MLFNKAWLLALLVSSLVISVPIAAGPGKDLREAAKEGDIDAVQELLDEGVDPDSAGRKGGGTPLIKAVNGGQIEIVQLLLFNGADPTLENHRGKSALDMAEKGDDSEMVEILSGAVDERAARLATKVMSPEVFSNLMNEVLLRRKWQIEITDKYRVTAAYKRGRRVYKIDASLRGEKDKYIYIHFIKGYGSHRVNYINNLISDLRRKL